MGTFADLEREVMDLRRELVALREAQEPQRSHLASVVGVTGTSGARLQRFKVTNTLPCIEGPECVVGGDYVVARAWDGTTLGAEDINLAKPYDLRRTPFDGKTIGHVTYEYLSNTLRTALNTGQIPFREETQVLVPRLLVGEEIVAQRGILGGTGVVVDGEELVWEMQSTPRAWTEVFQG